MSLYVEMARRLYEGEFNYAFSISLKNKYVYVENAKAACTVLKSILGEWEFAGCNLGSDIPRAFLRDVHINVIGTPFVKPFQLGEDLFNDIIQSAEYFRFSFVRNPYTRLLSAYLDKVVKQEPAAEEIFREAGALGIAESAENLSFLSFLRCIESRMSRTRFIDKHWRPQHFQLNPEAIRYDFIGKVETFEKDMLHLSTKLNRVAPDVQRSYGHETQAGSRVAEYYNEQTIALLLKIYDKDFEHFSYDKAPPEN